MFIIRSYCLQLEVELPFVDSDMFQEMNLVDVDRNSSIGRHTRLNNHECVLNSDRNVLVSLQIACKDLKTSFNV